MMRFVSVLFCSLVMLLATTANASSVREVFDKIVTDASFEKSEDLAYLLTLLDMSKCEKKVPFPIEKVSMVGGQVYNAMVTGVSSKPGKVVGGKPTTYKYFGLYVFARLPGADGSTNFEFTCEVEM